MLIVLQTAKKAAFGGGSVWLNCGLPLVQHLFNKSLKHNETQKTICENKNIQKAKTGELPLIL